MPADKTSSSPGELVVSSANHTGNAIPGVKDSTGRDAHLPGVPNPARSNLLCAGRMVYAGRGAFGAIRVTVTCNQTGEAAGVAAALAARAGTPVAAAGATELRRSLAEGGSIMQGQLLRNPAPAAAPATVSR